MTNKTKAAIEQAADTNATGHDHKCAYARHQGFTAGAQHVIEHPERYDLTARKPLGIQETLELVRQMLDEEISFSRFVELINEGGTK